MRKWLSAIAVFLFVGGVFAYTSIFRITKNFYEVDPGRFYRSAQMTPAELEETVQKFGIKTVISVRGYPQSILNMEPEAQTLARLGVHFYKFDLSTDYFPPQQDLLEILNLFKSSPLPILVHCRSGSDRTGLISAIYQIEEMKKPKSEAENQLSFEFWHVRSFHPAMIKFLRLYQGREWAAFHYNICDYPEFNEDKKKCSVAR